MMERLELGPVPCEEQCAQVGSDDYTGRARKEISVYRAQLQRLFPVPDGVPVRYVITRNPHDFGTYLELAVEYDSEHEASVEYAWHVESHLPKEWDERARQELAAAGLLQAESA